MGWIREDAPGHEGFVVGLVRIDYRTGEEVAHETGFWRELRGPHDDQPRAYGSIRAIQVACDCGWRSARIDAPYRTTYHPFAVDVPEDVERRLCDEWIEHAVAHTRAGKSVVG